MSCTIFSQYMRHILPVLFRSQDPKEKGDAMKLTCTLHLSSRIKKGSIWL
jgi:hypothetical protein